MIVVVSPHLDDAVLSCGGLLALAARRGERSVVISVFTEGHDHARRRREDLESLAIVGAQPLHLGLLDAPERLGVARTHAALVEQARIDPGDVATVRAALTASLAALGPIDTLLAPLGVGGHVDHLTVHAALRDRDDVAFYEDRPYALVPGALRARLFEARIALAAESPALEPPGRAVTLADALGTLPHLSAFLGPDPTSRARSLAWLEARLAEPRPDPSLAERVRHLRLHALDDAALDLSARAVEAHASQGRLLPDDRPGFERTYHLAPRPVR